MTDKDKRRRIARRFLEDPVPPRIHRRGEEPPSEPSRDLRRKVRR